jgi:hypothetical protein
LDRPVQWFLLFGLAAVLVLQQQLYVEALFWQVADYPSQTTVIRKSQPFKLDQEVIFDDTFNEPQLPKYQISRKSEEVRFKAFTRRRCL